MSIFARSIIIFFLFIFSVILFQVAFATSNVAYAATTPFRSASIITTDGSPSYTNLGNCSVTDGQTCDRATGSLQGNLYFRDFGTYSDFGIAAGATITKVRIRVTGKASVPVLATYVGLSSGTRFVENCQWPSDLWTMWDLNSATIKTQIFVTDVKPEFTPGAVLSRCLSPDAFENKSFIWRINYSSAVNLNWSANIDNFEIAFDYEVAPTPTPTPSPTPTPGPAPFLDLPWDYTGKGLTFNEAALAIESYFDHEYPLLSGGLLEPIDIRNTLTTYRGEFRTNFEYSSHDGYDYAIKAKVNNGDPVLAAASGVATYHISSAGGNMIFIDHGNGYQTRYLHLQKDGLITLTPDEKVNVTAREKIGQVGSTGHVIPKGIAGAHIHFGVFQDKNNDGNFEDNVPDGATDPFGWQSKDPDPWPAFVFDYGGQRKTGNTSYYLWKEKLDNLDATLTSNGGIFKTERYELNFQQGSVLDDIQLIIQSSPVVKTLDNLRSIGSTIVVNAFDALGNAVTDFTKPFTLTVDFSSIDLTNFNTDTIFLYSSTDGINWVKEQTAVDLSTGIASSELNHLTHFALMAERLDTTSPVTTAILNGEKGQENWLRSDVSVSLNADDGGGLGVDYTLYKKDGGDWGTYIDPLVFTNEGHHKIEFYSVDKDENIETIKSVEFYIDKTPPETDIQFDTNIFDMVFSGRDGSGSAQTVLINLGTSGEQITITDKAGNTLAIVGDQIEHGKSAKINLTSLQYNGGPLINLDTNSFLARYSLDNSTNDLRRFEQIFETKGELKLKLDYSANTNITKIITTVNGQNKQVGEAAGVRTLKLSTENGTIKYSY